MPRTARSWSLADAQAQLSEIVERALTEGPQRITWRGPKAVVVVAAEEWERRTAREGTLAEFFASSPLRDSGIDLERVQDGPGLASEKDSFSE